MCRLNTTYPYAPARNNRKMLVERGGNVGGFPAAGHYFPLPNFPYVTLQLPVPPPTVMVNFGTFAGRNFLVILIHHLISRRSHIGIGGFHMFCVCIVVRAPNRAQVAVVHIPVITARVGDG